MKNANIFVDVDQTLVDANGRLLNGARENLQRLQAAGCHLFLWSSVGAKYALTVAERHGLTELFEGFTAKPDIVIDDMPATAQAPFVYTFNEGLSWPSLTDEILRRHIDSDVRQANATGDEP